MALTEDQLKAVEHLIQAGPNPNYKSIAAALEITERTLYNWRQLPEFQNKLSEDGANLLIGQLHRLGLEGDVGAAKLYMQYMGLLKEGDTQSTESRILKITPEQLQEFKWDIYEEMKILAKKQGGRRSGGTEETAGPETLAVSS